MDTVQLATAAVAVLAPFLSSLAQKAGTAVVDRLAADAGAGAGKAVETLYQAVQRKFAAEGNEDAEQSLKSLAAKPDSQPRQAALAEVLEEQAKADPGFAEQLARLVQDVEQSGQPPAGVHIHNQLSGNARVDRMVNAGTVGEVNFH